MTQLREMADTSLTAIKNTNQCIAEACRTAKYITQMSLQLFFMWHIPTKALHNALSLHTHTHIGLAGSYPPGLLMTAWLEKIGNVYENTAFVHRSWQWLNFSSETHLVLPGNDWSIFTAYVLYTFKMVQLLMLHVIWYVYDVIRKTTLHTQT